MTFDELIKKTAQANTITEIEELLAVINDEIGSGYWHYTTKQYKILHDCKSNLLWKEKRRRGY